MFPDLLERIAKFQSKKILVVGDIILDKYIFGEVTRINPEMPSAPLVYQKSIEYRLGGAANVAKNISSLGGKVYLCGVVGEDEEGRILKELCEKEMMCKIIFSNRPTTLKTRLMAHGQQIARIDREEIKDISKEEENILLAYVNLLYYTNHKPDAIIVSDYAKGVVTEKIAKEILNHNIVLVDTKPKKINYFKGCTLIAPNKKEAEEITGMAYKKENLEEMAKKLKEIVGAKYVVITLGEDGMFIYNEEKKYIPAMAKEVYDVTGAGDTVMASLALSLSSGASLYGAALIANAAAGIVVGKIGTAATNRKELEDILKNVQQNKKFG